ncbi:MAG: carbohydrate kinase family protein [Actinobacteria bacterium]|nr:carbohydrate kinase family protein [Actinomycetota bacterium]NCW92866.1 carbohydrate kinase family protein [Actinomycetota bacterium]NCX52555.1 carbohydrate kinase family protein [Actinomycetota bacterium]NCZ61276.1 carbohydrate kinase family protein [Actinomycetota bacterium]NDC16838.1 carbohydrate kinase family protein [Actinomycetota bacterium]
MKIGVAGSVGLDHLMTFSGKFTDSFVSGSLEKVSLSFLVDSLDVRRGGCAANICYGMGVLGLNPVLIAAVGKDWADYEAWLSRHGVDTSHALVSTTLYTAHFMVTTDDDLNQIASFFPGAMSEARNIELGPIMEKTGRFDMVVISPDDPQAMLHHSDVCRKEGIPFAADPSQQMARMSGEEIKLLIDGASYLFLNEYELALAMQKTGWSDREILEHVKIRVVTLGSKGAKVESAAGEFVQVGVPQEKSKTDPTGVGDSFRSGFIAGLAWGLSHERCAQLGSLIATYVIETMGTQEYRFTSTEFLDRFEGAYGAEAASQIAPHLSF